MILTAHLQLTVRTLSEVTEPQTFCCIKTAQRREKAAGLLCIAKNKATPHKKQRRRIDTGGTKRKNGKLRYETPDAMQKAVEAYFDDCAGKPLTDENGDAVTDKNGSPVIVGSHPPTVTGLALWLGFSTRLSLLGYKGRSKAFDNVISTAVSRCEEYAERRLFDKECISGAKFALANNFEGWNEKQDNSQNKAESELPQLYKALTSASGGEIKKS